ncbi:MAG: TlpA family protein disulfide reductase [Bdellovibrionales bacterium]|nr:TlpA family protein disulfide reductase [Bdellovibrionales bacterium]
MNAKRIFNTISIAILAFALFQKAPSILTHFKFQDQRSPNFSVMTLKNENITLNSQSKKLVIVFWATWCGPCEVELKRINKMIMDRKILANDVLAISIQEDPSVVKDTVKKNNYLFDVATDQTGTIARAFQVSATPTIILLDKNQVIHWMTAGMSPTLEFRISSFIKP